MKYSEYRLMKRLLTSKDIMEKIQSVWGLNTEFKAIGSGSYGTAYTNRVKPNVIFKLTYDPAEVKDAKIVMKLAKKYDKYFAKVYKIYTIRSKRIPEKCWLIEKEMVDTLDGEFKKVLSDYFSALYQKKSLDNLNKQYVDNNSKFKNIILLYLKNIEIWKKAINAEDYHDDNIGFRKGTDDLVLFDYGDRKGVKVKNRDRLDID